LNYQEREELAELIRSLPGRGSAVVLVDHNLDFAFDIGDRVVVLDFGTVIMSGAPEQVMADPRVRDAYLGAEAVESGTVESGTVEPVTAKPGTIGTGIVQPGTVVPGTVEHQPLG